MKEHDVATYPAKARDLFYVRCDTHGCGYQEGYYPEAVAERKAAEHAEASRGGHVTPQDRLTGRPLE